MCRLPPIIVLLCSLVVLSIDAEVVKSLAKKCKEYFFKGHVPRGFARPQHARICQRLGNSYYYATLFDKDQKIPVYSSYRFNPGPGHDRSNWYYEPQVSDPGSEQKSMKEYILGSDVKNQATDEDYSSNLYTKGHLNPFSHNTGDAQTATCTYTNAVPQSADFNNLIWSEHEQELAERLRKTCKQPNTAFVIVGAIPSSDKFIGERVNVPDFIWAAFCCADNNKCISSEGYWAENKKQTRVNNMSVSNLEKMINNKIGWNVTIFPGNKSGFGEVVEELVKHLTSLYKSLWAMWDM